MYAYKNMLVSMDQLAKEACDIEVNILGKPIGFQDQYIAAFGGLRFIEFNQNGSVEAHSVIVYEETQKRLSDNLLLFFTGVTRKAESILTEQKGNISSTLPLLRKLKEMVYEARDALMDGRIDDIGHMLHESWQIKKQLAHNISNSTIEDCYKLALDAGALGGKVTGAGGGGFLLLYCPIEKRENVRAALSGLQEVPFQLEPDGTKVVFNYRY
jgi:D-glycero-alpha-D-manno-heptose-7-phosphate kinase